MSFAANEMMAVMVDGNPLPIAERCLYAAPHSKGHPSCPIVYVLGFACCVLHVACRASGMIAVKVSANPLAATESQSVFTAVVPAVPLSAAIEQPLAALLNCGTVGCADCAAVLLRTVSANGLG